MMNSIKMQLYLHAYTYTKLQMEKITMKVKLTLINESVWLREVATCHVNTTQKPLF